MLSFESLCQGVCELANVPAPPLDFDENGALAMEMRLQGVTVLLTFEGRREPDRIGMSTHFGTLPQDRILAASRALLDLNSQALQVGAAFARDPLSGEVVLQQAIDAAGLQAVDLYARIVEVVRLAQGWREHQFVGGDAAEAAHRLFKVSMLKKDESWR